MDTNPIFFLHDQGRDWQFCACSSRFLVSYILYWSGSFLMWPLQGCIPILCDKFAEHRTSTLLIVMVLAEEDEGVQGNPLQELFTRLSW